MAKIDYERDYYADLELPPTADVADIKKQFKKLALKYHPDRNPGNEDVVKDKFVVIQAAHEILTDPASKAKVDNYRRRPGSRFSAASGVKGNPYQDLAKEMADRFGPPPTRRAQPATRPAPAAASASRYSGWGVPPTAKQKMADATDNLRAWDRMRTASGRGNQSSGPSPTKPQPPPPPPRTAGQARRQEAAFGSPTKKTGYAPKSPMGGDEPPVANKNGYTNIHSRMFDETAANLRRPKPDSGFADPMSTQFGDNYSDDRQRTPYASHIGEKTNPFEGVGVNRAKSAREAFRGHTDDSDTPPPRPQRQRSASVDESDRFKKPTEKAAHSGSSASPRQQSRASARYSPHGTGATSTPSTGTFAPKPTDTPATGNANGGASKSTNGPTVYDDPISFPSNIAHSSFPSHPSPESLHSASRGDVGSSYGYNLRYTPEKTAASHTTTPSGDRWTVRGPNQFEMDLNAQLQHLLGKHKMSKQSMSAHDSTLSPKNTGHRITKRTNANHPASFSVPLDEDTFDSTARFMRNSTDNINTRFVAEEKAGENFMFNAGGAESSDPFLRAKQRSRSTPRGRQSPQRTGTASSTDSWTAPQPEAPPRPPKVFDPNQWEGGFEPHHFVPPPVAKPSTSPTRANRGAKKSRPVRQTAGTAGLVDEEGSSSEERTRPNTAADGLANGAASPNAMDIDPPPPEPIIPPIAGARTINVEPTKPEWRAGNVNGVKPGEGVKMGNGVEVPKVSDPNKVGSEDAPDFIRPDIFADFKNVEPFAPSKPGLASFGDLASNLPFPSKASANPPIEKAAKGKPKPTDRIFPNPPIAPRPPTVLAVSDLKPSMKTWDTYVHNFEQYLRDWNAFNNRILDHFQARRRKVEESRFAWATKGDAYALQEYLNGLEEDRFVRQRWVATTDAHELHVREFSKALERMKS